MDIQTLRDHLSYDPATGNFTWIVQAGKRGKKGSRAGCHNPLGYNIIRINKRGYSGHRLAWLYMTGELPLVGLEVDHVDGDPGNNVFSNLRLATKSQNAQNVRRARRNSKAGLMGIHQPKGCKTFVAQITIDGVKHRLGSYPTAQAAHEAYVAAKRELHERSPI